MNRDKVSEKGLTVSLKIHLLLTFSNSMANTKASLKDIRQIATRTEHNKHIRSRLKTLARKVKAAREAGDAEKAKVVAREYVAASDKAAKSSIIHPNKADRHKATVSDLVN
jgi:small subunit ribosomal protein S20